MAMKTINFYFLSAFLHKTFFFAINNIIIAIDDGWWERHHVDGSGGTAITYTWLFGFSSHSPLLSSLVYPKQPAARKRGDDNSKSWQCNFCWASHRRREWTCSENGSEFILIKVIYVVLNYDDDELNDDEMGAQRGCGADENVANFTCLNCWCCWCWRECWVLGGRDLLLKWKIFFHNSSLSRRARELFV